MVIESGECRWFLLMYCCLGCRCFFVFFSPFWRFLNCSVTFLTGYDSSLINSGYIDVLA